MTEDNQPMLSLKKVGANVFAVSVMSLEYVETVLRLAGDKKLLELRSCLEGTKKNEKLTPFKEKDHKLACCVI